MINDNQTNRGRTKLSVTRSESLAAFNDTTNRKVSLATEGLPYVENWLRIRTSNENALTISEYVLSLRREINPSQNYTKMQIQALVELSEYLNQKPFGQLTSDDVLSFLNKFRKTEDKDPLHKWIGTYNLKHELLRQFFTWFNDPNTERNHRSRPKIMENIGKFKRKEVSIYKPTDLWTGEDDLLFLRYCPNKRDTCYHTLSRDSSCRPDELVKLRIKDVIFKTSGDYQYAEITVSGKTGTRTIPLFSCIPYLKDWIDEHPQRGNSNAILFASMSDKSFGRKMTGSEGINQVYRKYKLNYFPRLLENPNVAPEDKIKIKELESVYPKRIERFEYKLCIVDTLNTGEFPTFSDKLADELAKVMQEIELMKQHVPSKKLKKKIKSCVFLFLPCFSLFNIHDFISDIYKV